MIALPKEIRNKVLKSMIYLLDQNRISILTNNRSDLDNLDNEDHTISERLVVNSAKIDDMICSLEEVILREDPIGNIISKEVLPNGLTVLNKSVPFGTIFIIFESRPDVIIEATALAFKAGNRLLLKGGKEAVHTNRILVEYWHQALTQNGASKDWVELLEFTREQTQLFLQNPSVKIDLVVPRGGESLISFVKQHSSSPVIVSGRGNNFAYVSEDADWEKVKQVVLNAKTQKVSACNALDKIIIDRNTVFLKEKLSDLSKILSERQVKIELSKELHQIVPLGTVLQSEDVWDDEFLSLRIVIGLANNLNAGIDFINSHSGGHSAIIFTENEARAEIFMDAVDCSAVYHNASTRFTDGGQLGMGAELAISTDKLHHRGPLGLEHLVTNKFYVFGNGQIRN